ncbi:PIN domain-containing protein [Corynebacterium marquesiae]|uniref:PIN domain-containing protein n=1 Tax=Corynebacterium marquesiae TaxID=2913503 RepID=UPI00254C344A|nr:PIN domain-containing protein [Corynebacterium marquesiae]MDK8531798.1 PIN domain-containing protein [Corynebacterium marquesiae]
MGLLTVVYDANVLYPSMLRDVLIRVAGSGVFHARWTEKILDEVFFNLQRNRPDLNPKKLSRTRRLMCLAVEDCLVTGYEELIDDLWLPDPNDRHVLAAAISCGAQSIITENVKDFPCSILDGFGIRRQSADEFLCELIASSPAIVQQSIGDAAAAFQKPPRSVDEVLTALALSGTPRAVEMLRS